MKAHQSELNSRRLTVKISGGDQRVRTSTLIRDRSDRGEGQDYFRGETDGFSSTPRQDSSWYDGEAKSDTTLDVMSEKHIEDYWNVDGEREWSDAWTGFTTFMLLNEKQLD